MIALCLLAPLLAGQIIAAQADSASSRLRRDHDSNKAFASSVTSGCSDDWPLCGTSGVCYNPHEGQTCCPGGTYACPSSTFCLTDGYCCPNDLSPSACAQKYGLTIVLTSSLPEPTQLPGYSDSSSSSSNSNGFGSASDFYGQSGTSDPMYPQPTMSSTSASSVTITSTPIPTSSVAPWPSLSVTFSPETATVPQEPAYTGAGSRIRGGMWNGMMGVVPVVVGVLGI